MTSKTSERMLKRWRKEALQKTYPKTTSTEDYEEAREIVGLKSKILRMTQELLDQYLIEDKK